MAYSEQITISIIRDNGERRSLRLSRRLFLSLIVFFVLLVPLCICAVWQAASLWLGKSELQARLERAETALATALATAQRLQNLEILLNEAGVDGREYVLRKLATHTAGNGKQLAAAVSVVPPVASTVVPSTEAAGAATGATADQSQPEITGTEGSESASTTGDTSAGESPAPENREAAQQLADEGGDGEPFQGVDLGYVRVSNVTARLGQHRRLRLALDLHNTEKQEVASGTVEAILLTADGGRTNLEYTVEDAGNFRISFFKRAVMLSRLPSQHNLTNAQILVEIRNHEHTLVYSNLYPVVQ